MTKQLIKLFYNGNDIEETTTFEWLNDNLELISVEGTSDKFGSYSSLNPDDKIYVDEDDAIIVENYLKTCGANLLKIAKDTNSVIYFKKEIWLEQQPALVESWLEKDGCTMLRKSTRLDYYNNVFNLISDSNSISI